MSDLNLLAFGCAVTFIAVAGVYVYIRESFESEVQPGEVKAEYAEAEPQVRDVA